MTINILIVSLLTILFLISILSTYFITKFYMKKKEQEREIYNLSVYIQTLNEQLGYIPKEERKRSYSNDFTSLN
jgi:uncharacterized membrane protein